MKNITLLLFSIVLLASCGQKKGAVVKLPSGGAPYEVIVVADDADWTGALGDTIRSVLTAPVPVINSYEPQFDVLRILPDRFVTRTRRNGNVVVVDIDKKYTAPSMRAAQDEFAQPQTVVYIEAPDAASLIAHVTEHGGELRDMLNAAERRRWVEAARGAGNTDLEAKVAAKFGLDVAIPKGFVVDKATESVPDFLWAKFDYPESFQTLAFYSYPATGADDLTLMPMIDARDRMVSNIVGSLPNSHMITVREVVVPTVRPVVIGGREWMEMRGFWEVAGDIMGGPFVSYSTLDQAMGRILVIDGSVYSPSPYKPKRNLLRQVESVVYTATIK
jgi:hypothetical protein